MRSLRSWSSRSEAVGHRHADPWLWLPGLMLLTLGSLMVLSTTYFIGLQKTGDGFHFFKLHLAHLLLGALVLLPVSRFSLTGLRRIVIPLAIVSIVMLAAVFVPGFGVARGGAERWLRLGPMVVQPSELAKFAMVFTLAAYLAHRPERMRRFGAGPLPVLLMIAPVALLVLRQPDFGSTVTIVLVTFAMLYAAGARPLHLAATGLAALCVFTVQATTAVYRWRRLVAFVDPWRSARGAGFQLVQSFIALGSGGGWGVGLGASRQKMSYLPQAHTDFVFAVVGEELGLVGALTVIALFVVILLRGMRIARREPDAFAGLLAFGLTVLLSLEAFENIAVVIGMVPTKGLALPFVSYGGSATVIAMATLGVMLALSRRPAVR